MALNWNSGRMQSGKLRHRIDIVRVNPTQDSTGGFDLSKDILYANVWAAVEAMSANETLAGQAEMSNVTHQIVIRYIAAAPAWEANHAYPATALVKDSKGYLQKATVAGTSGAVVPTWNQTQGGTTIDGDISPDTAVTWVNMGVAPPYTGVTAAMQVLFQGRQFQITSVRNPDERNKILCLMCVELNDSRQQHIALIPSNTLSDLG